jgi:hypothetical protein
VLAVVDVVDVVVVPVDAIPSLTPMWADTTKGAEASSPHAVT